MRYASIRSFDISNGEGVGVSLFVQGCPFHCYNCFNPETWDFGGGKEWTQEIEMKFMELINRPYITRVSILGGEPLADENLNGVLHIINQVLLLKQHKTIWLYTGFKIEDIIGNINDEQNVIYAINESKRYQIISKCNVVVDGPYIDSKKDTSRSFKGSLNQRIIDVEKTLKEGVIKLWNI